MGSLAAAPIPSPRFALRPRVTRLYQFGPVIASYPPSTDPLRPIPAGSRESVRAGKNPAAFSTSKSQLLSGFSIQGSALPARAPSAEAIASAFPSPTELPGAPAAPRDSD